MDSKIDTILKKIDTIEELYEKENKLNIILQKMMLNPNIQVKNKNELIKLQTQLKSFDCVRLDTFV